MDALFIVIATVLVTVAVLMAIGVVTFDDDSRGATSDRILVLPIKQSTEVKGLARAETSVGRPREGVVVLAGPGKITDYGKLIPMTLKKGDLVSFASYAGTDIVNPRGLPPETYLMLRQDEVLLNHGPQTDVEEDS